ncbi:MAG: hypothetical protein DLM73_06310 [Chthoniobacterales bacterium]|nr:MAG: hypothetical protein DLM73_06310 [Chthoniobacterales bacterium]
MKIQEVIAMLNQMERDGVIDRYAIGGAVGATFYLEPMSTLDVDVFIAFRQESIIVSLAPIFDYLKGFGCKMEGEYIVISGWPVQFLPASEPLLEEALNDAIETDVDGAPARVFTPEHLAAIALQTGRAKDKARLLAFIEAGAFDAKRFQTILAKHGLLEAWQKFERQFLSDTP